MNSVFFDLIVILFIIICIMAVLYLLSPFAVDKVYIDREIRKVQARPLKTFPKRWQIRARRDFTTRFLLAWLPIIILTVLLTFLYFYPNPSPRHFLTDPLFWISLVLGPVVYIGIATALLHRAFKKERWMLEILTDTGELTVTDPHNRRVSTTLKNISEVAFVRRSAYAARPEWKIRSSRGAPSAEFFPTLYIKGQDRKYLIQNMPLSIRDYLNLRAYLQTCCRQNHFSVLDQYGEVS